MGAPILPSLPPSEHMAALVAKAGVCLRSNYQVQCSNAPIHDRVRLLQKFVWASMAWSAGIVAPSQTIINMLNTFQGTASAPCVSSADEVMNIMRTFEHVLAELLDRSCLPQDVNRGEHYSPECIVDLLVTGPECGRRVHQLSSHARDLDSRAPAAG